MSVPSLPYLRVDLWLRIDFDVRTGIDKVQHKLSQKYVGLWPFYQELFFFTKLRIWLMVWSSDPTVAISCNFRLHSRAHMHFSCRALKSSDMTLLIYLHVQVYKHLYLLDFLSIQKRMALMVVKAFLLDGKKPWDRHDIFFASHLAFLNELEALGRDFAKVVCNLLIISLPIIFFTWYSWSRRMWVSYHCSFGLPMIMLSDLA